MTALRPLRSLRPLDTADDAALAEAHRICAAALQQGRPHAPVWSLAELAHTFRDPDPGEEARLYGWFADGAMVGTGSLFLPLLDNREKAWLLVFVDPAAQGRGHGTALLAALVAEAQAADRTTLLVEAFLPAGAGPAHPAHRMAARAGFELATNEVVRHLDLPVPEALLDTWIAEAAPHHAGYEIVTYVDDAVPDDVVASLVVLHGQLAVDAPTGSVQWEEERITPERFRAQRASSIASGLRMYETLAIAPDGAVAAQSTLAVRLADDDVAQWGTFVHREHRGHRLGLAVKAANLRAVQRAHPTASRVHTQNEETNRWMIAINERMGFRPVEDCLAFVRNAARP